MNPYNAHNPDLVEKINEVMDTDVFTRPFTEILYALAKRDYEEVEERLHLPAVELMRFGSRELEFTRRYAYDYLMKIADDRDLMMILNFVRVSKRKIKPSGGSGEVEVRKCITESVKSARMALNDAEEAYRVAVIDVLKEELTDGEFGLGGDDEIIFCGDTLNMLYIGRYGEVRAVDQHKCFQNIGGYDLMELPICIVARLKNTYDETCAELNTDYEEI